MELKILEAQCKNEHDANNLHSLLDMCRLPHVRQGLTFYIDKGNLTWKIVSELLKEKQAKKIGYKKYGFIRGGVACWMQENGEIKKVG